MFTVTPKNVYCCSTAGRTRQVRGVRISCRWSDGELSQHVVSYSISAGSIVNVVAMVSEPRLYGTEFKGAWVTDCSPSEVQVSYGGWEPEVQEMLKVSHATLQSL